MVDYGWSKLTGVQFGINDPALLNKPLQSVDKFHLAWYLFSLDKTFNLSIGILQLIGALLIVINRTAIIGTLFLLPILLQIFLIDLAFTTDVLGPALPMRMGIMILCDLLILAYYKDSVQAIWQLLSKAEATKSKYKWWVYLLLPVLGLSIDFLFSLLSYPIKLLIMWFTH